MRILAKWPPQGDLLINAKDALLQDPRTVQVSATPTNVEVPGVMLTVRHNGPGIPPALGTSSFEPFVTTKRARGGTIDVTSVPGHYTEFRVWLPRDQRE